MKRSRSKGVESPSELIDARIDARNPRTASRELPRGALRPWHVVGFALVALAVFLVAVYQLAPLVRWLWPIPVAAFVIYPYLKRWSWTSHLALGAIDALAPVGAWAAVANETPWEAWALGGAVAAWVAGFDLLYALFDDRLLEAFGFPQPAPVLRRLVPALLRLRGRLVRLLPERRRPRLRTGPRRPTYPNGYRIEDLGPRLDVPAAGERAFSEKEAAP